MRRCGPDAAATVHRLTRLAFRDYDKLDPPSGAVSESEASVREDLERGGGALARIGPEIVGCLRFELADGYLQVRRVAVDPAWQSRGIGRALMSWAHEFAREAGVCEVRVGVRLQLPQNRRFYERLGYTVLAEHRHPGHAEATWIEMRLAVYASGFRSSDSELMQ